MKPFTFTIEVARPREDVFAYVTDPDRLAEWQAGVVEVRHEKPLRAGSRLTEVRAAPGGKRVEQTVEVSALEPPHVFDLRILDGPIKVHGDHRFEAAGAGTRIHVTGHGELSGAKRLLRPLLPLILKRHYRRLRARLEGER